MIDNIEREQELKELEKQMTPKQLSFCNEYLKLGNGRQAAINAGYSENSAHSIANENLNKQYLKKFIQLKQEEIQDKTIADAIEIQQYLTAIIRGEEVEEVFQGVGGGQEQKTTKTPSISDRTRAAELLGRRYALFTDRTEVAGNIGATIVDDIPNE